MTHEKKIYPVVYVPTYCNLPHRVATGRPIGHECITIPVAALKAEIDGDYDRAIAIMQAKRRGMPRGW